MTNTTSRRYVVTVTPSVVSYAGSGRFGEYTVEVMAKNAADANKRARAEYRDENGREAPAITCRAKLAD